jgi:hypothetical protein
MTNRMDEEENKYGDLDLLRMAWAWTEARKAGH